MKRLMTIIGAMVLLLSIAINASGQSSSAIEVYIDGEKVIMDTVPIVKNNRTLVPLRGVFEGLGATVDYNKATKQVIVKDNQVEVLLETGNDAVLVNGRLNFLDTASEVINDRTLVPIRFVVESLGHDVRWDGINRHIYITKNDTPVISQDDTSLPVVGDFATLAELIKYSNNLGDYIGRDVVTFNETMVDVEVGKDFTSEVEESAVDEMAPTSSDQSNTNVQVEGVDEGDITKSDANYIYYTKGNVVYVIDKNPDDPKIITTIEVDSARGSIRDLYVEGNNLVIIGSNYAIYGYPTALFMTEKSYYAPTYNTENTFMLVYDMSNATTPELSKDMDFEGSYKTSRLVDDKLYMVANRFMNYWEIETYIMSDQEVDAQIKELYKYQMTPKYSNNITGEVTLIDLEDVRYFPDYIKPNYLITIGIDLSSDAVDVDAYLGMADTVYATTDKLFLGFTHYEYTEQLNALLYVPEYASYTSLYQFELDEGSVDYVQKGMVQGTVLNQFSLDYYENHLRIATSIGDSWRTGKESTNNVYILDDELETVGSITGLAEGERIYSTRFSGDRIYMVTFRQVDPFFVIDASVPTKPEVLGYLKIPGFSTYMHVLDENHILGFGKDTTEEDGFVQTGGFKISLFDVTDPRNPVEESKEVIGLSGTYSELENNHKALMISLSKGVMGFPITVASKTPYSLDFSGAYVYNLSSDSFSFRGLLSHQQAPTSGYFYGADNIRRLLYIGDYLYTLSDTKMMVNNLNDMTKISEIEFP